MRPLPANQTAGVPALLDLAPSGTPVVPHWVRARKGRAGFGY